MQNSPPLHMSDFCFLSIFRVFHWALFITDSGSLLFRRVVPSMPGVFPGAVQVGQRTFQRSRHRFLLFRQEVGFIMFDFFVLVFPHRERTSLLGTEILFRFVLLCMVGHDIFTPRYMEDAFVYLYMWPDRLSMHRVMSMCLRWLSVGTCHGVACHNNRAMTRFSP